MGSRASSSSAAAICVAVVRAKEGPATNTLGYGREHSRRVLRLGLQPLAQHLLPQGSAPEGVAGVLHQRVRHRRAQQLLLPSAEAGDVRRLAPEDAQWVLLRG